MIHGQHEQATASAARPGVSGQQQGDRVAAAGEGDRDRSRMRRLQAAVEHNADRRREVGGLQDLGGG
jgi:hypothetical protein